MKNLSFKIFSLPLMSLLIFSTSFAQIKKISKDQLEYYLSKSINAQQLSDYCRTPNGIYPGTNITIVDPAELASNPPSGSIEALKKQDMLSGNLFARYQDVLRLIKNVKPKLITDAVTQWGAWDWYIHLNRCTQTVKDIKAIDADIIVQASVNEFVDNGTIAGIGNIPQWVYDEFRMPNENRPFRMDLMQFSDWRDNENHWWGYAGLTNGTPNAIVPDISTLEAKMWFYYQARAFIDMGCESIQFSQVGLMNNSSYDPTQWMVVFNKLRAYAYTKPNIRFLLITGHTYGMKDANGNLAFDYHSNPIRPSEQGFNIVDPNGGSCNITNVSCDWYGGDPGKIYNRSLGGISPSGWYCNSLPGLVFLDNFGNAGASNTWGQPLGTGTCNMYHFDEISWFAIQDKNYRDNWLNYAYNKVRCLDPNIFFSLPVKRVATYNDSYSQDYLANNPNGSILPTTPTLFANGPVNRNTVPYYAGYGQENTIKNILAGASAGNDNWVHHNFTDEDVYDVPTPNDVVGSLVFVGTDKMYYISTDGYVHGYIKDNGIGMWRPVNTAYTVLSGSNPVKAKSDLVASPDGTRLLFIGVDDYVHSILIINAWSYFYSDFVKTEMQQQNLIAITDLIFTSNQRAYYIAKETSTNTLRVHGFNLLNGTWTTISPTYSSQVTANMQVKPSIGLTYDATNDRLYYVGQDGFLYYYKSTSSWQFTYNVVPQTQLIQQQLRIRSAKLAIFGNRIYYIGQENGGNLRIHALIENNGVWTTVSPSHSADAFNNQNINSQVQPQYVGEIAVSPNGQFIAYIGTDNKVYYYKDLGNSNFSYNKPVGTPLDLSSASNSLQYTSNNRLFYVSDFDYNLNPTSFGFNEVHYYNIEESFCENQYVKVIEPSYVALRSANNSNDFRTSFQTEYLKNISDSYSQSLFSIPGNNRDVSISNDGKLEVYPNPADNLIKIKNLEIDNGIYKYRIFNTLGVEVMEGDLFRNSNFEINTSNLLNGIYYIAISDMNKNIIGNKKIIIKR